ncbi:putative membrane protein [Streptococcus mitis]|uniref:Putative membrane protein n=1 Tax=Streptococcus mitis TaxID=28037 RepID=A0A081QBD3_STRMT|nr:putative membrane protein [Streptococcus mitis]
MKTIIVGFYMDRIIKLYLLLEKMCFLIGYVVGDLLLIR